MSRLPGRGFWEDSKGRAQNLRCSHALTADPSLATSSPTAVACGARLPCYLSGLAFVPCAMLVVVAALVLSLAPSFLDAKPSALPRVSHIFIDFDGTIAVTEAFENLAAAAYVSVKDNSTYPPWRCAILAVAQCTTVSRICQLLFRRLRHRIRRLLHRLWPADEPVARARVPDRARRAQSRVGLVRARLRLARLCSNAAAKPPRRSADRATA